MLIPWLNGPDVTVLAVVGDKLRILYKHLGRSINVVATSAAAGFPATNLETGNRHRYWKATSSAEQTLTYDAGAGNAETVDTVILPRADLLAAVGASVDVQWSADGATNWTSVGGVFPLAPISIGDLAPPATTDLYAEFTAAPQRGWRIRLYGSMTGPAMLAGDLFLGERFEVAKNPLYNRPLGVSRAHRGLEVDLSWGHWGDEADAQALLEVLGAITPDAAEAPHETAAGVVYGGLPHHLFDPVGAVFRTAGTPYLLPALCLTPESAVSATPAKGVERGPSGVRWRERR